MTTKVDERETCIAGPVAVATRLREPERKGEVEHFGPKDLSPGLDVADNPRVAHAPRRQFQHHPHPLQRLNQRLLHQPSLYPYRGPRLPLRRRLILHLHQRLFLLRRQLPFQHHHLR